MTKVDSLSNCQIVANNNMYSELIRRYSERTAKFYTEAEHLLALEFILPQIMEGLTLNRYIRITGRLKLQ